MAWTKYNNPNRRRRKRAHMSRTDADIIAAKEMLLDGIAGREKPIQAYDAMSDALCGKSSRHIYDGEGKR